MHDDRQLTEGRLTRFIDDVLPGALYRRRKPLQVQAWHVPGEPVPVSKALAAEYRAVEVPFPWGAPWSTSWFRVRGSVPPEWFEDGRLPAGTRLEVAVDLGFYGDRPGFQAEGLAFLPDGSLVKGIAPRSAYVPWPEDRRDHEFFIEAAANPDVAGEYTFRPTPLGDRETAGAEPLYTVRQIDLGLLDTTVWELAQDIWTLRGLMAELPVEGSRRWQILRALERMIDVVDPDDVAGTAARGREELAGALSSPAVASAHRVVAVGHAHIDTAWLWPLRETIRKCARTFASAVALMDEYPEYRFACSSAQQLFWIKRDYPDLFQRIREKVATGQFIPVGGMWVEPDMNMPGGESMARQLVLGKRFFLEEFGVDSQEAWVPDTFGYSAAIPQILREAGMRWFMTQKISWNQTNEMPHTSFLWEGIDGSQVFTHFPSADTYISELSGAELAHAERNFKEKGTAGSSLVPFGWGDGGGGPTREMLAAASRLRSLDGSPTVEIDSPEAFFERAEAEYGEPPVWVGELYLELHRGSLTSQHRTKQGNRRNENLLLEAELWAATAAVRAGASYPYREIEAAWQTVLLHQFHDILPGTSIAWVHQEVEEANADVERTLERIIAAALAALSGPGERELVANARSFPDAGVLPLGVGEPAPAGGELDVRETEAGFVLSNSQIVVGVDQLGHITSLRDTTSGREAIPAGESGNVLMLHRDTPNLWDAWDVDVHYRRAARPIDGIESIAAGREPDAVTLTIRRRFGTSSISQVLRLERGAGSLAIENTIDWKEKHKLLKLVFPIDVHADRFAAETQFGHVFRPTHVNTSWDAARFEVSAHRWIHVAEPGYGVAIANESTYGHDVTRHTVDGRRTVVAVGLSLLRSPEFPDPGADQGEHVIRFAVRPGAGIRDAVREGTALNLPQRRVRGEHPVAPVISVSHPGVSVSSVKLAEDGGGDVVVRVYESEGARAEVTVTADFDAGTPRLVDLLERDSGRETVAIGPGRITLSLGPFQLATVRIPRL